MLGKSLTNSKEMKVTIRTEKVKEIKMMRQQESMEAKISLEEVVTSLETKKKQEEIADMKIKKMSLTKKTVNTKVEETIEEVTEIIEKAIRTKVMKEGRKTTKRITIPIRDLMLQ
jgi:hypothetical protein